MKKHASSLAAPLALALALGGCIATNPSGPRREGPEETPLPDAVASTRVGSALSGELADVAVDPGSGDVVVVTLAPGATTDPWSGLIVGSSIAVIVDRATGVVLSSAVADLAATSVGVTAASKLLLSDGSATHVELDLASGGVSPMTGLLEDYDHAPYTLDAQGGGDLAGPDGEVVTFEEFPCPPSEIAFWTGKGADRRLSRTVELPGRVSSIFDVAYAPERGLLYALTGRGLVALSAETGELVTIYTDTERLAGTALDFWGDSSAREGYVAPASLAYDGATGRLLVATGKADVVGGTRIDEYEL